jgi:hypothetical protein
MAELLKKETLTAKDISQLLSIREKEVFAHLEHIAHSIAAEGYRLRIEPCRCLACGYVFEERKKFSRPGKCPKCRETRIKPPRYHIERKS